jgi:hypothetical protein
MPLPRRGADNFLDAPFLELPVIGGIRFYAGHEPLELSRRVFNALCAQAQLRKAAGGKH